VWAAVLVAVVAQFMIELVIAVHYGLAVVPITVLSLVLLHLAAPGEDLARRWAPGCSPPASVWCSRCSCVGCCGRARRSCACPHCRA
jgi:hypothetical protein